MERVRPERDGTLTVERIAAACREDTALVSVMLVNNETGARHPLETLVPEIRRISPALIHTDAVQAAGRIPPLSAERMGVDLLTVSGHKLHAPKGVGALYVRKRRPSASPPDRRRAGRRPALRYRGGAGDRGFWSCCCGRPALSGAGSPVSQIAGPPAREVVPAWSVPSAAGGGALYRQPLPARPAQRNPAAFSRGARHLCIGRLRVLEGEKGARSSPRWGLPAGEIDSALRVSFSWDNTLEEVDRLAESARLADHTLVRRP